MLEKLIQLLREKDSNSVKFTPEIKVRQDNNTIFISEIRKIRGDYFASVETYKGDNPIDKAILKVEALTELSMKAIFIRMQGMGKVAAMLLIIFFCSCTHQVYITEDVVPTDHGLIHLHNAKKFVPNGDTIKILFQASAFGKTKAE